MWKNLLLVGILAVVVCTLRCLTRQRRKEKGIPIFSVKARQHVILSQPVLQTTPVFTYEHGEQDRILIKKYYHGRTVTAGYRKFRIDRVKKIPREKAKKQIPLRLSASLYSELAQWAEDDFRSINGQIEYLLTECVKKRKKQS